MLVERPNKLACGDGRQNQQGPAAERSLHAGAQVFDIRARQSTGPENEEGPAELLRVSLALPLSLTTAEAQSRLVEWAQCLERARHVAKGQELIEILEIRGIVASERGDIATARSAFAAALEVGKKMPNGPSERIAKRRAALELNLLDEPTVCN